MGLESSICHLFENIGGDADGHLDVFAVHRRRDKACLKLRAGEVDSALQAAAKESGEHLRVRLLRVIEVVHGRGVEKEAKHAAAHGCLERDSLRVCRLAESVHQLVCERLEALIERAVVRNLAKRGDSRRHRERVAA